MMIEHLGRVGEVYEMIIDMISKWTVAYSCRCLFSSCWILTLALWLGRIQRWKRNSLSWAVESSSRLGRAELMVGMLEDFPDDVRVWQLMNEWHFLPWKERPLKNWGFLRMLTLIIGSNNQWGQECWEISRNLLVTLCDRTFKEYVSLRQGTQAKTPAHFKLPESPRHVWCYYVQETFLTYLCLYKS